MPSPATTDSQPVTEPKRRRGAPRGNTNRRTHGQYAQPAQMETIDDVIADALRRQTELSTYIDAHHADMNVTELLHLFGVHGQNASRLGRLLRDARALSGASADGLLDAIGKALDEIGTEIGTPL